MTHRLRMPFYFYFFYLLFFHAIHPDHNSPSLHCSSLLQIYTSCVPPEKRKTGLPGISVEHCTTRYNKINHRNSTLRLGEAIHWKKKDPRQMSQRQPYSHCQESPPKHQANNHNVDAEALVQTHAGTIIVNSVSVRPQSPCLADFRSHAL